MQTRQILALHSNEPTAEWGDGPLGRVSAQLLAAFQAKEAARLGAAETNSVLAGKGPVLAALQRRFAEESAAQLFDVAMPMATRQDFREVLREASLNAPKDRGLKVAAKHAEQLWLRDQSGVLAVGDVARFRAHYSSEYPRTTVAAVLDAELPKIGFNTLPVQKLAQLALSIQGSSQEDLEHSYTTIVRMNGLDSDKTEHKRARAYLRGLVNLAEEDNSRTASMEGSALERTLQRMATGDDEILRSVTAAPGEVDEHAMQELELYLENTGELHNQKKSIIENLQRKMKSGRYDPQLAPKLWMYWVDAGAKGYVKEFGGPGDSVQMMFPRPLRMALATQLAAHYEQAIQSGEYGPIEKSSQLEGLDDAPMEDSMEPIDDAPMDDLLDPEPAVEVDSPITGEPLSLELGMSMEPDDVEGLAHFGQLDDFSDDGGFMGDGVDDGDIPMADEGAGETSATIEDPSAPGEFIDVTLTPAGEEEESALVPAPMDVPMATEAARKSTFSVFAIRAGQRGKEPIDSVSAASMPLALAAIGARLAEVGSSDYQVRAPADEFRRHALIVLDAAAGNHLYVVAEGAKKPSKSTPSKSAPPKGVDMEPAISGQPDDVVSVGADGGKTLTASAVESKLLADEAVTAGAWKIFVNASGDVELQKSGKRIIAKSLVEMDEVISTFIIRAGVTAPPVAKAASYELSALMLVGCQGCGGLDEYLMPKVAAPVKCARCLTETPARVIAAQLQARPVTPGYVLVTDIPGEDKAMNARRLLMAMREVHPSAQGDVREDGRLEVSLRSIDERALSRIRNVLASKFGVHHQLTRAAKTAQVAGTPEKPPMMGVNIAPAAQPPSAPTYTPPTPAINPPLGLATPAPQPQQMAPSPQSQQVGPAQTPGISLQMPVPTQTNVTPAKTGFKVVYRSEDGRSRAMPVEARDEGMARRIFASYRGDVEVLSVTAQALPPDMPPEVLPPGEGAEAPPPSEGFAGPSQQMQTISPEIKEAIGAAMMTFRNSGIDVASGVKTFQTQFKKLIERFGDETAPARQALGAEIIRAAQNAWSRPALLEMAAARTAGDTEFPAHLVDQAHPGGHGNDFLEDGVDEFVEAGPGMSVRTEDDLDMPDDAERVELGYPVKGQRQAADGKPGKPGKMPLPSGIKVQQPPRVSIPKNVLGPDSEGDDPAVMSPKVKTQHGSPGGKLSPTQMGGGEEDLDPKVMNPKKPPADGSYGLVGKGTSLSDTKLGPDSQTGNNSTTKQWDSVSKGAPKNIRSK